MVDFSGLIKKSLSIVNDGFQEAKGDLQKVVGDVRESINENAGEQFGFEVSEVISDMTGTVYRVAFDPDTGDLNARRIVVTDARISSKGYPIALGLYRKMSEEFSPSDEILDSKEDIEKYFANQLTNPESKLIQALGFALRRAEK